MASTSKCQWSLTEHLLTSDPSQYQAATQSPFLLAAAEGRLPKTALGRWLANDRLYVHAYIRGAGLLLHSLQLPRAVPQAEAPETQIVDWLTESLAAVRKEERLFIDAARRYGLDVELKSAEEELPGLGMMQNLFESAAASPVSSTSNPASVSSVKVAARPLEWLEGAVVFWGTERCYLDAWSWAKAKQPLGRSQDMSEDADGGAVRKEFIPSWSSAEFGQFVSRLGHIIDDAVDVTLKEGGEKLKEDFLDRVDAKWKELLAAEIAFWPEVD